MAKQRGNPGPAQQRPNMRDPASDPYEADSDHEYSALEADAADEARLAEDADRFEAIDTMAVQPGEDAPEQAAPRPIETAVQLRQLQTRVEESVDRDPEAVAANQARVRALESGVDDDYAPLDEPQPPLEDFMDRTPLTTDGIDTEELLDPPAADQ